MCCRVITSSTRASSTRTTSIGSGTTGRAFARMPKATITRCFSVPTRLATTRKQAASASCRQCFRSRRSRKAASTTTSTTSRLSRHAFRLTQPRLQIFSTCCAMTRRAGRSTSATTPTTSAGCSPCARRTRPTRGAISTFASARPDTSRARPLALKKRASTIRAATTRKPCTACPTTTSPRTCPSPARSALPVARLRSKAASGSSTNGATSKGWTRRTAAGAGSASGSTMAA